MEHEQIERINELARKKKTVGLTEAEALEQARLRAQYLKEFRANMEATLQAVRVEQPDGSYTRRFPGLESPLSSQNWLYDEAYRRAAGEVEA